MHVAHTRSPAAGSVGVTAKSQSASGGGLLVGGLKVSMYEVLMNQYVGDIENVVLKEQAKYMTCMNCQAVLEQVE